MKTHRHSLARGALFLGVVAILPCAAVAGAKPSFDCAKASAPIEKTICRSDTLSALDNEIAARFVRLRGELNPKAAAALVSDQRWFIMVRNAAGEAAQSLADVMEQRAKFLRAIDTHPADGFIGSWDNLAGGLTISAMANGTLKVSGTNAEPTNGRWICDFDGRGKVANGVLTVKGTDSSDKSTLRLTRVGASLNAEYVPDPDAPNPAYCGANGSLEGNYFAVPKSFDSPK